MFLSLLAGRNIVALCLVAVVTAATMVMQFVQLGQLYLDHNATYYKAIETNGLCKNTKDSHPNAHEVMNDAKCDAAASVIQMHPFQAAFLELVNTTWPHTGNLRTGVATLMNSNWFYSCLFALAIVAYPKIARFFASCGDAQKKANFKKAQKTMELLLMQSLANVTMPQKGKGTVPRIIEATETADATAADETSTT